MICENELLPYLFAFVILFVAGGVQGMSGMGYSMLATALLPIFFPFKSTVVSLCGFGFISGLAVVVKNRKSIRFKAMIPVLIGTFLGVSAGMLGFVYLDANILSLAFGALVVAISCFMLISSGKYRIKPSAVNGVCAGTISGLFGGACNVPGPPLVIYYMNAFPDEKDVYFATTTASFFIASSYKTILYVAAGAIDMQALISMALVLAPSGAGFLLGRRLFKKSNSRVVFIFVYCTMLCIGLWVIVSGLLKLT